MKAEAKMAKLGIPFTHHSQRYDWGKVDWVNQDIVIANDLGCSRERVRQARLEYGRGIKSGKYRARLAGSPLRDRLAVMDTDGKTLKELAKEIGASESSMAYLRVLLKELGKGYRRKPRGNARYDWGKFPINWKDLTDKEIADIVGVENPVVVTIWRNRHGFKKNG